MNRRPVGKGGAKRLGLRFFDPPHKVRIRLKPPADEAIVLHAVLIDPHAGEQARPARTADGRLMRRSAEFAPGVAEKIVAKGYEPEFGARSINRYIEDTIEDAVVNQIIAGSVVAGGVLSVTAEDI